MFSKAVWKFGTAGVLLQTTTNSAWGLVQLLTGAALSKRLHLIQPFGLVSVEGSVSNLSAPGPNRNARPGLTYHPARGRVQLQLCCSAREKSKWIPFGKAGCWMVTQMKRGLPAEQKSLGDSPWIRAGSVYWSRLPVKGFKLHFLRHGAVRRCWFLLAVWKNC